MLVMTSTTTTTDGWVVGIRLDPDSSSPTFFLVLLGKGQEPVLVESQLLLTSSLDALPHAVQLGGFQVAPVGEEEIRADLVVDYSALLFLLGNRDEDQDAVLVNGLNILFDLVSATGASFPDCYRQLLYDLTDHMTFHRSLRSFIDEREVPRATLIDGVLWGLGWVLTHARYFTKFATASDSLCPGTPRPV